MSPIRGSGQTQMEPGKLCIMREGKSGPYFNPQYREDGTRYDYYYDAIGQLTNAAATLADDTPWQAYQYGYQYDNTGNPVEQDKNGMVYSNSFNYLNQNVATAPGGSLAVLGRVNYAGGTVTVNSVQAQLSPGLIFAATGIPFTLGSNALDTVFTDPFGRYTNQQTSVVVSQKAYQYDANGNLTNDSRMAYFWDDENRLVAVRDAKTGDLIQENRYDGRGRRRERLQSAVAGGDDPGSTNRYIYQDWLVLAVTDGEGNVLETYTHGADLSGQVGGAAGGICGILASTQASGSAYYHYDFNGNVVNVSSSNQTQLAKYTYSPFGEVLLKEGEFDSRYQFSTKEYDDCTGLNYYGYRVYSPGLGRWLARDPLGEIGGPLWFDLQSQRQMEQESSESDRAREMLSQAYATIIAEGGELNAETMAMLDVLVRQQLATERKDTEQNQARSRIPPNSYVFARNAAISNVDVLGLYCLVTGPCWGKCPRCCAGILVNWPLMVGVCVKCEGGGW